MAYPSGKSAYPTDTDLGTFLTNAGFDPSSLDLATGIAVGIDQFQDRTGRVPFLASPTAGVSATGTVYPRQFDPPATDTLVMDTRADICRAGAFGAPSNTVLATACNNAAATNPAFAGFGAAITAGTAGIYGIAIFINGTLQLECQNYWVMPTNQDQLQQPFRMIGFNQAMWPLQWAPLSFPQWRQAIVIVAQWGYWYTIPQSVWSAMIQLGAAYLLSDISDSKLKSMIRIEQRSASQEWDPGLTAQGRVDLWMTQANKTVANYRRQVI